MFPGRNLKQTSSVPSVVAFRANAIVRWVRGMGTVFAVTRNASKSPIASQRYLNRNATSAECAPANSEVAGITTEMQSSRSILKFMKNENGLRFVKQYFLYFDNCTQYF